MAVVAVEKRTGLVECPECGRKNVSSSADGCPSCGYHIKSHFVRLEEKKKQKLLLQSRLDQISMPEKPQKRFCSTSIGAIAWGGLCLLGGIGGAIGGEESGVVCALVIIFGLVCFVFGFLSREEDFRKNLDDYNLAKSDFEAYKRKVIAREDAQAKKKAEEDAKKPTCPICGTKDVKYLDSFNRAVSVELMGAASAKIGKQYQCRNCGHLW